jgi:hypothetical protein
MAIWADLNPGNWSDFGEKFSVSDLNPGNWSDFGEKFSVRFGMSRLREFLDEEVEV